MMDAPYTKTPNAIYAALADMSEAEMRVTLALVRETYGYHRDSCKMTYAAFAAYGLTSPDSIRRGIEAVLERGFFGRGDGRSEFTIVPVACENTTANVAFDTTNTTVNVENDDPNTTATVMFADDNTTVNVEFDTPKHYGKRSVSLLKKEREEKERRGERARAREAPPPPPAPDPDLMDGAEERWKVAQLAVRQWARRRHLRTPDPDNAADATDYFRPALELARERPHLDEYGLFDLLWQAYQEMRAAGLTPRRLGPLVDQILAPPITARPYANGHRQLDNTTIIQALWE